MGHFFNKSVGLCLLIALGACNTTSQQSNSPAPNPANSNSESDAYKVVHSIKIYDAIVEFPEPSWFQKGGAPVQSKYYRNQAGRSFIFEQIPDTETFENWTKLYAVFGFKFPTTNVSEKVFAAEDLSSFRKACGKENFQLTELKSPPGTLTVKLFCPSTPYGPKHLNYGPDVGEVALYQYSKVGSTILKVYHEWRGPSFDINNPPSWPVSAEELGTMIERFKAIRFISVKG